MVGCLVSTDALKRYGNGGNKELVALFATILVASEMDFAFQIHPGGYREVETDGNVAFPVVTDTGVGIKKVVSDEGRQSLNKGVGRLSVDPERFLKFIIGDAFLIYLFQAPPSRFALQLHIGKIEGAVNSQAALTRVVGIAIFFRIVGRSQVQILYLRLWWAVW